MEDTTTYHEIDFLLPVQRFNINFSYVTQRGLPFVREYVLRLVHLAPMTASQIAIFFGFSRKEAGEAIQDLVDRDELKLTESSRLTLTEKSASYFTEVGDVPRLSLLRDSSARLAFDLATFTCLGRDVPQEKWKVGVRLDVDDDNVARSELHVEKHFQRQFNHILHQGFLSKGLIGDEKDSPAVYTVNSVNKIRAMPFRLGVKFKFNADGKSIEREDFAVLKSSDYVHQRITVELNRLERPENSMEIAKAMLQIGDNETLKLFDTKSYAVNLQFLDDLLRLESNNNKGRSTFLGPIYSKANWSLLQKKLAPILKSRIESKADVGQSSFLWLVPSDPYWSKSIRLVTALSDFLKKASTKEKSLYLPTIYFPVSGPEDMKAAKSWRQELEPYTDGAHALIEGFLGGNVEVLLLEGELVAVVYHMSVPGTYPVTLPLGFISDDPMVVATIGRLVNLYVKSSSGFDRLNDCGLLSKFGNSQRLNHAV